MSTRLTSTAFRLTGEPTTERQLRSIWHKVAELPDIGAIAFEVDGEGRAMIIKHKESVTLDRDAIRAAVRSAGPYDLARPSQEEQP